MSNENNFKLVYIVLKNDFSMGSLVDKIFWEKGEAIEYIKNNKNNYEGWMTITAYKLNNSNEMNELKEKELQYLDKINELKIEKEEMLKEILQLTDILENKFDFKFKSNYK